MSDDLSVKPLPLEAWDPSLDRIVRDMKGAPINVHKLMAHNPVLSAAWWDFRNYSVTGGALGQRKGELVILRVAVRLRAWYEWGSHVARALKCGIAREEIERVKEGAAGEGWEESEALLLAAVDELIDSHALSQETHRRLRQHYDVAQIMDVIAIHGMYVILGCMINTWGLYLDESTREVLPDDVTQEAFEAEFPR